MNITAQEFSRVNLIIEKAQKEIEEVTPLIIIEVNTRPVDNSDINKVVNTIYSRLRLSRNDGSRETEYKWIRDIIMFYLKRSHKFTLNAIGGQFGGKDHSSVISAIDRAAKEINENNPQYMRLLNEIENLKLA